MFDSTYAAAQRHLPPVLLLLTALLALLVPARPSQAGPTSLTYTGQLLTSLTPPTAASGTYDFQFRLFTAATGGSQAGPTVSVAAVPVVGGIYYVQLNFGTVFSGTTYWLEASYRPVGTSGAYTAVTPRPIAPNSAFADYATLSGSTQGLQSKPVSAAFPTAGQVLTYSGTAWTPATPIAPPSYLAGAGLSLTGTTFSIPNGGVTGSMLALPLALSASSSSPTFSATNTGSGGDAIDTSTTSGNGVFAVSASGIGVYGGSTSSYGLSGISSSGVGVHGVSTGTNSVGFLGGTDPVLSAHAGVYGQSDQNGVVGSNTSSGNYGVLGSVLGGSGGGGVYGYSASGYGAYGNSGNGVGVYANSGSGVAVYATSLIGDGVYANSNSNYGVFSVSTSNDAGHFVTSGGMNGVYGEADSSNGNGIEGLADNGTSAYGVLGVSSSGYAGFFNGKTEVLGNLIVTGSITAGTKDFRIDDPLDPANKYLYHASVESDKMEDVYHGHVVLDANGTASVDLPDWFEALNKDCEYTLTCVGGFAPVYVAQEVQNNRFTIAGGRGGLKVSWQITGVRQDAYANAHPLPVEEDKPANEQGLYLHPKEWGQPEELGIGYAQHRAHAARGPRQP